MQLPSTLPRLAFGDLISRLPIIQGGMGIGVSQVGLASAVAQAGGIGVIATAGIGFDEPDFKSNFVEANARALRKQIQGVKGRIEAGRVMGVNIMVALTNYASLVRTAVEEKADVIFSGAGLPLSLPAVAGEGVKTKLVPIISSARAASILCKKWLNKHGRLPDGFVVEGPKAGGHLGFKAEQIDDEEFSLEHLVPQVVDQVKPFEDKSGQAIPVVAAGGVFSGDDIGYFLGLGASGVQLGTRFVCTHECDAAPEFKQAFIDAREEDVAIIKSPVGMPGRAIRNIFVKDMEDGKRHPLSCPFHCLHTCDVDKSPFCICTALMNASRGMLKKGLTFAGANVHRVTNIVSVAELLDSLRDEYEHYSAKLSSMKDQARESVMELKEQARESVKELVERKLKPAKS